MMTMLTIMCEESILEEVWGLLMESGIKGYTIINKVVGHSETDTSPPPIDWEGQASLVIIVPPEERVNQVINALKTFQHQLVQKHHGHEAPFKVYAQPCERIC